MQCRTSWRAVTQKEENARIDTGEWNERDGRGDGKGKCGACRAQDTGTRGKQRAERQQVQLYRTGKRTATRRRMGARGGGDKGKKAKERGDEATDELANETRDGQRHVEESRQENSRASAHHIFCRHEGRAGRRGRARAARRLRAPRRVSVEEAHRGGRASKQVTAKRDARLQEPREAAIFTVS